MAAKIKNDASRYLTRAALAGAFLDRKVDASAPATQSQQTESALRDDKGTLDKRWYIKLPPKR